MCRSLSNTVIPLIPQLHTLQTLPSAVAAVPATDTEETTTKDLMSFEDAETPLEATEDDATVSTGMTRLTLSRG